MAPPGNVVLTGFMGTGKSTVGRAVAARLGYQFVDTDTIIEQRYGTIASIFDDRGEHAFRAIEREVAAELAGRRRLVISTGGRMMLDPANAELLGRNGRVFCLAASPDSILTRVTSDPSRVERPLLQVADPRRRIVELLAERATGYAQFPQIDTDSRSAEAIADEIVAVVRQDGPMTPDPYFDLTGKIALVTGGSRGLGYQMVRAFAERGADCIIASRKLDACEAVADEVRALGRRALAIQLHAAKWPSIDAMIEQVYTAPDWGRVDILVNNAGMSPPMASHEVTEELFDSVVGLNFKGPFRLASRVAKRMADGDGGVIVNVTSSGSLMPLPGIVPYGSAKAALNAMSRSLAAEYGPKVRVNTLSPGPFLTDIAKAWAPEQRETADNALGRPGNPDEIVSAALFLASPASSFTTGAIVRVDGGLQIGQ